MIRVGLRDESGKMLLNMQIAVKLVGIILWGGLRFNIWLASQHGFDYLKYIIGVLYYYKYMLTKFLSENYEIKLFTNYFGTGLNDFSGITAMTNYLLYYRYKKNTLEYLITSKILNYDY